MRRGRGQSKDQISELRETLIDFLVKKLTSYLTLLKTDNTYKKLTSYLTPLKIDNTYKKLTSYLTPLKIDNTYLIN